VSNYLTPHVVIPLPLLSYLSFTIKQFMQISSNVLNATLLRFVSSYVVWNIANILLDGTHLCFVALEISREDKDGHAYIIYVVPKMNVVRSNFLRYAIIILSLFFFGYSIFEGRKCRII
jgi:hypothetical protein